MKNIIMALFVVFISCSKTVFAFGIKSENGLSVCLGPGIGLQEVYSGSEETTWTFIPYIEAEYKVKEFSAFLSISDGLGMKYAFDYPGFFLSSGINLGNSRESSDSKLLKDTADISNYATYFVKAGFESGFFDFYISANWYPIDMQYDDGDVPDEHKNGFRSIAAFTTGYPVFNNLIIASEFGCTFIDRNYAEAYHGVKYSTRRLEQYKPNAGFENIYCEPIAILIINNDLTFNVQGRYERLLGDAAGSPLTKRKNVFSIITYLGYAF